MKLLCERHDKQERKNLCAASLTLALDKYKHFYLYSTPPLWPDLYLYGLPPLKSLEKKERNKVALLSLFSSAIHGANVDLNKAKI